MRTWLLALPLALPTACGGSTDPRLAPLAKATITVGPDEVALGDLRLGETTLGECFDRFGAGRVALVASDDLGLELAYEDGELTLLFLYDFRLRDDDEFDALRRATRDLSEFLARFPERRELRLASVTVAAGGSLGSTFFQGALAQGVKLFDPFQQSIVSVSRLPADERPPMLAGSAPDWPRSRTCFPELGLVLYGEDDAEDIMAARVTRIALFVPRGS